MFQQVLGVISYLIIISIIPLTIIGATLLIGAQLGKKTNEMITKKNKALLQN